MVVRIAYTHTHTTDFCIEAIDKLNERTNEGNNNNNGMPWFGMVWCMDDQEDEHIFALTNFVSTGNHAEEFIP